MSGFSVYYAQLLINTHFVSGATKYLALYVGDPTDANITSQEVSAAWYARQPIAGWSAPTGDGASTSNSNAITFPAVTGGAVTVTHWGILDAVTAGNLWASGALESAQVLNVDGVFTIQAGEAVLDFA